MKETETKNSQFKLLHVFEFFCILCRTENWSQCFHDKLILREENRDFGISGCQAEIENFNKKQKKFLR